MPMVPSLSSLSPLFPLFPRSSHIGHMIKFQFFEKSLLLNYHFKILGTSVVSSVPYMR